VSDAPGLRYGYFLLLAVYTVLAIATFTVLRRLARIPLPAESSEAFRRPHRRRHHTRGGRPK